MFGHSLVEGEFTDEALLCIVGSWASRLPFLSRFHGGACVATSAGCVALPPGLPLLLGKSASPEADLFSDLRGGYKHCSLSVRSFIVAHVLLSLQRALKHGLLHYISPNI